MKSFISEKSKNNWTANTANNMLQLDCDNFSLSTESTESGLVDLWKFYKYFFFYTALWIIQQYFINVCQKNSKFSKKIKIKTIKINNKLKFSQKLKEN